MKFLSIATFLVFCSITQAITFTTLATVTLSLISLNKPVSGFFGIFRRRKTPQIQETVAPPPPEFFPGGSMSGGMFNQFGGFGPAGSMFVPGLNNPQFGMYGHQFPPQARPPQMSTQKPPMPQMHQSFPPQGMPPMHNGFPPQGMASDGMDRFPQQMPPHMGEYGDSQGDEEAPGMNTEEAESFFTLLAETDESKCISRLVCEMGANPSSGGEFGQSIVEIIGSLKDFPDGSKVSEYNEVLNIGMTEGLSACMSKFSVCDDESFNMVKKAQLEDDGQSK